LRVTFAEDAVARVSRATLKELARELRFNEKQTVHYALAYLKRALGGKGSGDAGSEGDDYPPLTEEQLHAIRARQPAREPGGAIDSLIGESR
jgi:hypothetical protein